MITKGHHEIIAKDRGQKLGLLTGGHGRNFQKVPLTGAVPLKKGTQQLSLATEGISAQEILLDFRALELVPVKLEHVYKN